MNLVETVRSIVVRYEQAKPQQWDDRRAVLMSQLPGDPNQLSKTQVMALGDYLSSAFALPSLTGSREQGDLSGGGNVWGALVCCYLNLCLAGTDAIALTKKFIPEYINQALMVSDAGSGATKTESDTDVVVLTIPDISQQCVVSEPKRRSERRRATDQFNELAEQQFGESSLVVFQTKTNWNDSAQVPMLWNLIYRAARLGMPEDFGVAVGSGSAHIRQLKGFGYAFATVPTQKNLDQYKPTAASVVRVRSLTCGAYWGRPTRNGVIASLREFFNTAYNRTQHYFPAPNMIGVGYVNEVKERPGIIDADAYDLYRSTPVATPLAAMPAESVQ